MDQELIDLYDAYTHGAIERRAFFDRLAKVAGGTTAAAALFTALRNDYAHAQTVAEDDARLASETVAYGGPGTSGYLVRTKEGGKRGAVIVIHENRGLNAHIRDVTRRVALEGYLALGVDLLAVSGGTPADEDQAREAIGKLDAADTLAKLSSAVAFLAKHELGNGRVGAVGFCWGGGTVNRLAAAGAGLHAGVAYYGRTLPVAEVPNLEAPLLLHYAGKDERINATIPEFEQALKAAGKTYELHLYEGVNHAFNNDTSAARYDEAAAKLAWSRTLAFFRKHLASR
ncbi:MAG: dienelactone hydrolase family protein [Vicinamibacteria bacterium]|nr:dienelactone hydrolase family protein [Vicinamibacteria bacterium]